MDKRRYPVVVFWNIDKAPAIVGVVETVARVIVEAKKYGRLLDVYGYADLYKLALETRRALQHAGVCVMDAYPADECLISDIQHLITTLPPPATILVIGTAIDRQILVQLGYTVIVILPDGSSGKK